MSDKNYRPEHPEYKIPEQYEAYPRELNFGGETLDEAVKLAMDRLIAEPTKESAQRCLDEKEIEIYRGEYTSLLENDKPAEQAALDELLAEDARLKEKIKAQREVIQSITQKVNDKIRLIKDGTVYEPLEADSSLRIAVDGNYLHYTYAGGKFVLAKVCPIPSNDQGNLFSRQTKNQEVFIRMFGCDFTPSDTFEEVKVAKKGAKALEGRKLAASAIWRYTEDFVDEDTGTVVPVERTRTVADRDTILDAEAVTRLIAEEVESVVLYKIKAENDTPSA